jgi:hypothetical protein
LKSDLQHIPHWVKSNARWWSNGEISDTDFTNGIQFLIKKQYIVIQPSDSPRINSNIIPIWIKNDARDWANNAISDKEFFSGIQYLLIHDIIQA